LEGINLARVTVEIEGMNEVLAAFKKLGDDSKIVLHAAVNKGAEQLEPLIKSNIPVGSLDDIHLRDSIKISKAKPKKTLKQSANIIVGKKQADYGFHVETGRKGVPPKPFMRSTTDKHQDQIADTVANEILDRLGL